MMIIVEVEVVVRNKKNNDKLKRLYEFKEGIQYYERYTEITCNIEKKIKVHFKRREQEKKYT